MSCGVERFDWKPFTSSVFLSVSFHSFRTELTLLASNSRLVSNPSRATIVDIVMDSFAYWVPINLGFIPKNNLGLLLLPQSIFLRRLYESYIMIHPLCISSLKQLLQLFIYIYMFEKKANKQSLPKIYCSLRPPALFSPLGDVLFPIACDALTMLFIRKSAPQYI